MLTKAHGTTVLNVVKAISAGGFMASGSEEVSDAKVSSRAETLHIIEALTLALLKDVANGDDPILRLVSTHITPTPQ